MRKVYWLSTAGLVLLGVASIAYAQISSLPNATTPLTGNETLAIDQAQGINMRTVKTTINQVRQPPAPVPIPPGTVLGNLGLTNAVPTAVPLPFPRVPDNATLKARPTTYASMIVRDDFSANFGAHPLLYKASNSACPTNPDGDDGAYVKSADNKCWLAVFPEDYASVTQWGVDMSGVADSQTKMQAALAWAQATSGACLLIPVGNAKVSAELTITAGGVCIKGVDRYRSRITTTSPTANIIHFNGGFFGGIVSDLGLYGPGQSTVTNGAAIRATNAATLVVDRVVIEGTFDGWRSTDGGVFRISNVDVAQIARDSYRFDAVSTTPFDYGAQNIFLTNSTGFQSNAPSGHCVHILAAGEARISGVACGGSISGLRIEPTTGYKALNIMVDKFQADLSTGAGIVIDSSGGGTVQGVYVSNSISGFSGGDGVAIGGVNTQGISFSNHITQRNTRSGYNIINGNGITITGGQILSNSSAAPGFAGINVTAGTHIAINGTKFGGWINEGNINTSYSIAVQDTYVGVITIVGNDLCDAGLGAIFNASHSTDITIESNQCVNPTTNGFMNTYGGTATILDGTTFVTFNHHFPSIPFVLVTGTDIAHRYAATANATQITIASDTPVTGNKTVNWRGWISGAP